MNNYRIYQNVQIGNNVQIGDYVIIGLPPNGKQDGELQTAIGDHSIIRSHTVIYAGTKIGYNFHSGHQVTIRENTEIGSNVSIGTGTCIEHHVTINDSVRIHSQAFIPEYTILKNNSWIGPNVVITNAKYPNTAKTKSTLKGAIVEENSIVGANSTILPGVKIGKNSIVGAGAVVVEDVASEKVVVGNPAKIIKNINQLEIYKEKGDKS
ncbi:transferase [Anaerobacillus alkalilacustris]|uniref:Transferase n=1 Tax=Anaerobacillus alkalilacustris TaxID=393763 RepID=A0A1S2LEZ2_9BACI|nr:acyltransferase [Anaerobacillus alkalilacustris]OIJ10623.1 transferase [Anaerobacillus alkalilacustris]